MKKLVEVIAKSLVDHPDEVVVTETEKENATIVELHVAADDMGKVIGKQGRGQDAVTGSPRPTGLWVPGSPASFHYYHGERIDGRFFKSWCDLFHAWCARRG